MKGGLPAGTIERARLTAMWAAGEVPGSEGKPPKPVSPSPLTGGCSSRDPLIRNAPLPSPVMLLFHKGKIQIESRAEAFTNPKNQV